MWDSYEKYRGGSKYAGNQILNFPEKLLSTEKGFYLLIFTLVAIHFVFRGLLYPGAATDDAEQLLFSQEFRWGYDISNPPLYTWLVALLQKLTGVKLYSISIIKFISYGLIFVFLYKCSLQVLQDKFISALGSLSPILFYYIGWDAALSYSHSVLATALIAASLFIVIRIIKEGHSHHYIALGLIMGLGLLSKYTFALFVSSLILTVLLSSNARVRFLNPMTILSILIMGVIFLPHGFWLIENAALLKPAVIQKFEITSSVGYFKVRAKGLLSAAISAISFLSPLWLLLCILFWREIKKVKLFEKNENPFVKFFFNYFCSVGGLFFLAIIIFDISKIRAHYMFVLIPAPLAFFAYIEPALTETRSKISYSFVILAGLFVTAGGMVIKYYSEPMRCSLCQLLVPYSEVRSRLDAIGFRGGTIFAYYHPHDIAGNLRTVYPTMRIVSSKFPNLAPKAGGGSGQCLLIWTPKPQGSMNGLGMAQMLNRHLEGDLPVAEWSREEKKVPERFIELELDRSKKRSVSFAYMFLRHGSGDCK